MRDFTKVSPKAWKDARFKSLPDDFSRLLFLYFLTGPHQNIAGCFALPEGYACTDLGCNPPDYRAARQNLVTAELIQYDPDTDEVLILDWFRSNGPMNPDHLKGIERELEKVASPRLATEATAALERCWREIQTRQLAKANNKVGSSRLLQSGNRWTGVS